jgi:hypothetical protein
MNKHQAFVSMIGLGAAILLPIAGKAASVTIDDTSSAETITINWSGFLSGVVLNSVPQPTAGSFTINENIGNTINFSGIWNSGGLAVAPTLVDFYEDSTLTTVSDILTYSVGTGPGISTFNLDFTSDVEGTALSPRAGAMQFIEGLDATGNPLAYMFGYNNLNVSVTSGPEVVPEPSTTSMAGELLAVSFLGQRIRRLRNRARVS